MRKLALVIFSSLLSTFALCQPNIKVQAPNLVAVDEQFNITFIISGENSPSDFIWNAGEDFQLVWGPQKGTNRSVRTVNGKTTSSHQTTYTYVLLPTKTGKFTINPAVITIKGKQYTTENIVIEVVSDQGGGNSSQLSGQSSQVAPQSTVPNEDIFLRFSFSKTNVIVGEPLTATLKLYQRVNISGFENVKFPEFNGFWSQELQAPTNIEFQRENIGDKIYNAALLRSWTLIPQQSGELRIDPAELVCLVNVRAPSSSADSFFDMFFQNDYQTIRKRVTSQAVNIKVNALPSGAPASFRGGVGKFTISAQLVKDSLKIHDASSLRLTVKGSGNTTLLEAPKVAFPPDFEVYDVRVSDIQGGKLFEYPFIPRSHGDFVIDPIEYSYFDITTRKYVTISTQELPISVAKSSDAASASASSSIQTYTQKDVRSLGEDIRYIKTALPSFKAPGAFFVGTLGFWSIIIALTVIALIAYFVLKSLAASRADIVASKSKAAVKMARKRLAAAESFLKKELYSAFYEELHKALLGYVSYKFNMDAADMSKDGISERFASEAISEELSSEFVKLLDACEFARYAPSSTNEAMKVHYDSAVSLISSIEDSKKRVPKKMNGVLTALIALIMLCPVNLSATEKADSLWTEGNNAYASALWQEATDAWLEIESQGEVSWELYYNIGNSYYRSDNIAKAILYYERSLKLNPSASDARFNLELARLRTLDRIELVPEFFLSAALRKLSWLLPSNVWAGITVALFALALVMVLIFLLSVGGKARKGAFIVAIVAIVLSLSCLALSLWQRNDYHNNSEAIVMKAVSTVKSSPSSQSAKDLFILHEGTKVKLIDNIANWYNIELSDGRQGWIMASDTEII